MRTIRKTHPPQSLTKWIAENRGKPNFDYEYGLNSAPAVKAELKAKLIKEQGFLCAYTGRLIEAAKAHIEHLKPQHRCLPGEDVDYRNLVACFPADGGDTSFGYGAPVKGGWWDEALFVSPLDLASQRRFTYTWSGHSYANPRNHKAARETIKRIGLDSKGLRELRESAINGFFGFGEESGQISIVQAKILLREIKADRPPAKLKEYCFMLEALLPKYIAGNV